MHIARESRASSTRLTIRTKSLAVRLVNYSENLCERSCRVGRSSVAKHTQGVKPIAPQKIIGTYIHTERKNILNYGGMLP